jgi:hypothetical protein
LLSSVSVSSSALSARPASLSASVRLELSEPPEDHDREGDDPGCADGEQREVPEGRREGGLEDPVIQRDQ